MNDKKNNMLGDELSPRVKNVGISSNKIDETKIKKWFIRRKLSTATGAAAFMSTAALTLSPVAVATPASNGQIEGDPSTVNSQTVNSKKSQLSAKTKENQIILEKSLTQTSLTFQKEIEESQKILEKTLSELKVNLKNIQYSSDNSKKQKALINYLEVSTLATLKYNVATELALTKYEQMIDISYPLSITDFNIDKGIIDKYKRSVYSASVDRHNTIIAAYTELCTAFDRNIYNTENISNVSSNNLEYFKYKLNVNIIIERFEFLKKDARSNYYQTVQFAHHEIFPH